MQDDRNLKANLMMNGFFDDWTPDERSRMIDWIVHIDRLIYI